MEEVMKEKATEDNINNKTGLDRRKRINRMKTVIIVILIILILLPTTICIFLSFRVSRLQDQVNELLTLHGKSIDYEDNFSKENYAYAAELPKIQESNTLVKNVLISDPMQLPGFVRIKLPDHLNVVGFTYRYLQPFHRKTTGIPEHYNLTEQKDTNTKETNNQGSNQVSNNDQGSGNQPTNTQNQSPDNQNPEDQNPEDQNLSTNTQIINTNTMNQNSDTQNQNAQNHNTQNQNAQNHNTQDQNAQNQNTQNQNTQDQNTQNPNTQNQNASIQNQNDNTQNQDKDTHSLNTNNQTSIKTEADTKEADTKEGNTKEGSTEEGIYAGKEVYLTFDDGPSLYTEEILNTLANYKVKATFFVIGKTDKYSKLLYQRIIQEGHTLGMHSYSHVYKRIYNSVEDFDKDFTKLWELLYDTTGYKPTIFRFPGGSMNLAKKENRNDFFQYLKQKSIVYFDWNVLNGDATGVEYTEEQLIENVLGGVAIKKRSIVLMHDSETKEKTSNSLAKLLEALISGGANVLPLDDQMKPIQQIKYDTLN